MINTICYIVIALSIIAAVGSFVYMFVIEKQCDKRIKEIKKEMEPKVRRAPNDQSDSDV